MTLWYVYVTKWNVNIMNSSGQIVLRYTGSHFRKIDAKSLWNHLTGEKGTWGFCAGLHNEIVNLTRGGPAGFQTASSPFIFFNWLPQRRVTELQIDVLAFRQKLKWKGTNLLSLQWKGARTHLGIFLFWGGKSGPTGQGHRCQEVFGLRGQTGRVWTLSRWRHTSERTETLLV